MDREASSSHNVRLDGDLDFVANCVRHDAVHVGLVGHIGGHGDLLIRRIGGESDGWSNHDVLVGELSSVLLDKAGGFGLEPDDRKLAVAGNDAERDRIATGDRVGEQFLRIGARPRALKLGWNRQRVRRIATETRELTAAVSASGPFKNVGILVKMSHAPILRWDLSLSRTCEARYAPQFEG
jgi:hypothetical protein